jgi:hypothetical protein
VTPPPFVSRVAEGCLSIPGHGDMALDVQG